MPLAMEFFATAARGTEGALRDELRELRLRGVRADRGGVHFAGEAHDGWRACLWSRIAMRVLTPVGAFDARDGEALYQGARAIDWRPFLSPRHTLAVSATCRSSALTHTQFIAQKTKDAIVDQLRDALGARPSVDLRDPDVHVTVHLVRDHATLYVDLAGEPLHRRGYRREATEAPLKETLAAAILRLAGWDRARPLIDPMCGSGTFVIEGALWARNIAPGLGRARFGFERWATFGDAEARALERLRVEAREAARTECPEIVGSDVDERALSAARENARAAGVAVRFARQPVSAVKPTSPPGQVVTNPPYGERLAGGEALYREMNDAFLRLHGHAIAILAGTPAIARAIRPRYHAHTLFNGPIECRLLTYVVP
jgi:putative N6-adenine-specific DNA methylase